MIARIVAAVMACFCVTLATAHAQPDLFSQTQARLDDALTTATQEGRFSSAVVAVIGPSGQSWTKGYGVETPDSAAPPDPEQSRYLIASITKTMVAVAILQLHERGQIDSLDDPANLYLTRIQLDAYEGRQITVRHLLTHTSGLRTLGFGHIRRHQMDAPVNAAFARAHTTNTIRPPGEGVVYSNVGMSVLGVLLEDITGQTLQDYMQAELFAPLGMDTAVLNYEVAPTIRHARAMRVNTDDTFTPLPFDANTPFKAPAGSVMATAADMVTYMRFVEARGEGRHADVLSPASFNAALSPQQQNHPRANPVGLGFFIQDHAGLPLYYHAGQFSGYTSYFAVSPQTGVSAFIAVAGLPDTERKTTRFMAYGEGATVVRAAITGRPHEQFSPQPLDNAPAYAGSYLTDRRFTRGIGRLIGLRSGMRVTADADGFLTINGVSGFGSIAPGVIGTPGSDDTPPQIYGLSPAPDVMITTSSNRAHPAHWHERQTTIDGLLIAGLVLTAIGAVGGFAPVAPTGPTARMTALAPVIALLATGGIAAAILAFYPPGQSIISVLIAGEPFRVRLINVFSWSILAMTIVSTYRLFTAPVKPHARVRWGWAILRWSGVAGCVGLSAFVLITGLADPRQV